MRAVKLLRKIGDFALFAVGFCVAVPVAASVAYLVGVFVLWPISLFNEHLTNSLSAFAPALGKVKVPVIVIAIGCLAIWVGARVANKWKRERERAIELEGKKARVRNFLADRGHWIIGLSVVALLLTGETAKNYIKYDKEFHKADRLTMGHIVEVDPGEPASGAGEDADPGSAPSSRYEFQISGITYNGSIKDELSEGEEILVCYNASDPKFNHAQEDHGSFYDHNKDTFFLLILVLAALAYAVWHRKPDAPEREIDIGDGSFESLRRAWIERVHRDPTRQEEAKLRKMADRIEEATQEREIALQKLSEAIDRSGS
jgi:hypothetical protein